MNKKLLKLFGEMFLKTMIVILGVGIVVFAIYMIVQVGKGSSSKKNTEVPEISTQDILSSQDVVTEASTEEASTEATTAAPEPISSVGHSIEVLNSTEVAGVAAGWRDKLTAAGFTVSQIGNYETEQLVTTKIIVSQEGMGQDLLSHFNGATIEVGTISSGAEIQIIIGTSDAQ